MRLRLVNCSSSPGISRAVIIATGIERNPYYERIISTTDSPVISGIM
jgi:hypothetical protein